VYAPNKEAVPGHIRGYDVRTGKRLWTFHTIPQAGEFGADTWEKESWKINGNTGVWTMMSADLELGYVYLPVETPSHDFYGGHRLGDNLFAESLVCLDAKTGKRVWHFQIVHHGVWDYDPPAAPILGDIVVNGRKIKSVTQLTKQGMSFVFDRVTGKPVWPIEERAVPKSEMPGEQSWPTQPFSTLPPSARQVVKPDDVTPWLITDAERAAWRERISKARTGMFTPPALTESAIVPGAVGGTNWGNTAANPGEGMLYLLNQDFPSFYKLEVRDEDAMQAARARFGPPSPEKVARGQGLYKESCAMCHGEDRGGTPAAPSLLTIGSQIGFPQLKRTIVYGNGRMPPIGHISDEQISDILAFFGGGARPRFRGGDPAAAPSLPPGPVVASGGAPREPVPQPVTQSTGPVGMQDYPEGVGAPAQRYFTDYGLGYPYLLAPPWSTIVAYDLNRGVIKWRKPLGQDRDVAKEGGKDTGVPRGSQRQGMIVTSTGLVFSTARDGVFRAFDAETGEVLWQHAMPMTSEGLPAIYEVKGKHYLVVNATTPFTWGLNAREGGIGAEFAGKGAYVVFSIP
jgi:quinoprotein glucose dehydrogenase